MPYTTLVAGTTITASWANANVRDQGIPVFATAAARDAAVTSPIEGMHAYTSDTNTLWVYTGTAWVLASGDPMSWLRYTAGDFTLNSTAAQYAAVTATALDLTVAASAGDILEYTISGLVNNAAVAVSFDVMNVTGATYWSNGTTTGLTFGQIGWRQLASVEGGVSGSAKNIVAAGDVSGGLVKCRLTYRTDSAVNRILHGGTTGGTSLYVALHNHGPKL